MACGTLRFNCYCQDTGHLVTSFQYVFLLFFTWDIGFACQWSFWMSCNSLSAFYFAKFTNSDFTLVPSILFDGERAVVSRFAHVLAQTCHETVVMMFT